MDRPTIIEQFNATSKQPIKRIFHKISPIAAWRATCSWPRINRLKRRTLNFEYDPYGTIVWPAKGPSLKLCISQTNAEEPNDRDLKRRAVVPGCFFPENLTSTSHVWVTTKLVRGTEASLNHLKSKLAAGSWQKTSYVPQPDQPPRRCLRYSAREYTAAENQAVKRHRPSNGYDSKLASMPDLSATAYEQLYPGLAHPEKYGLYRFGLGKRSAESHFKFEYDGPEKPLLAQFTFGCSLPPPRFYLSSARLPSPTPSPRAKQAPNSTAKQISIRRAQLFYTSRVKQTYAKRAKQAYSSRPTGVVSPNPPTTLVQGELPTAVQSVLPWTPTPVEIKEPDPNQSSESPKTPTPEQIKEPDLNPSSEHPATVVQGESPNVVQSALPKTPSPQKIKEPDLDLSSKSAKTSSPKKIKEPDLKLLSESPATTPPTSAASITTTPTITAPTTTTPTITAPSITAPSTTTPTITTPTTAPPTPITSSPAANTPTANDSTATADRISVASSTTTTTNTTSPANTPLTPHSILRNSVRPPRQAVRAREAPEWEPITLDNLHLRELSEVITLVDTALNPSNPVSFRTVALAQIKEGSEVVTNMLKLQQWLYRRRRMTGTMRGDLQFDWTSVNWKSQSSINKAWTTLIYNEKKYHMTWEGIRPSNIKETASIALTRAFTAESDKRPVEMIAKLQKKLASTPGPLDLKPFGIDEDESPAGLTDIWTVWISGVLDIVNDCTLYAMTKQEKLANRGEWHRRDVVIYHEWLASENVNYDIPAGSALHGIHRRFSRQNEEGDAETREEKARSLRHGKSVGFAPEVKCATFDMESREVLDRFDMKLRYDGRGAPRRLGQRIQFDEYGHLPDPDSYVGIKVQKACASLLSCLIVNATRIAQVASVEWHAEIERRNRLAQRQGQR